MQSVRGSAAIAPLPRCPSAVLATTVPALVRSPARSASRALSPRGTPRNATGRRRRGSRSERLAPWRPRTHLANVRLLRADSAVPPDDPDEVIGAIRALFREKEARRRQDDARFAEELAAIAAAPLPGPPPLRLVASAGAPRGKRDRGG